MQILHANIVGDGIPLVVLHGFLGMSDNWKTMGGNWVAEGFQVHMVDQRNHGRSFHDDVFNYEVMVEDLYNYVQYHKLGKFILLGHSMGGKTAMLFAVTYPDRVEKLLVADIAPKFYPPHHTDILNGLAALDFDEIKGRKEADDELAKYITDWGTRQFLLKNLYWETKEKLGYRFNLDVLKFKGEEIGEALPGHTQYTGPVLFLKGELSGYIKDGDEGLIKEHFPDSRIVAIAKAGHWLHAENPADFYKESLRFMKE